MTAPAPERPLLDVARSALADYHTETQMWEAWAINLREALGALVRATRGHLGAEHPLIARAEGVMRNG